MKTDQTTTIYFPSRWHLPDCASQFYNNAAYYTRWHRWDVWFGDSKGVIGWCVVVNWQAVEKF